MGHDFSPLMPQCGRADLIRLLDVLGDAVPLDRAAPIVGYVWDPSEEEQSDSGAAEVTAPTPMAPVAPSHQPGQPITEETPLQAPAPVPFWRLIARSDHDPVEAIEAVDREGARVPTEKPGWSGNDEAPPRPAPLRPWSRLMPHLRRVLTEEREGRAVDARRLVRRVSRGKAPRRLPRVKRSRWPRRLVILEDRSRRLAPFWADYASLTARFARLVPPEAMDIAAFAEGFEHGLSSRTPSEVLADALPGSFVLVLGDLGVLEVPLRATRLRHWEAMGHRLRAFGCIPVCLFPAPLGHVPEGLRRAWTVVGLEPGRARADTDYQTRRLLRLLAPASRVEPGLLRAVRRLPEIRADAAVEAALWQHASVASASSVAVSFDPKAHRRARAIRPRDAADRALRARVLERIRTWRTDLPPEIWFEEILQLHPDDRDLLPDASDLEEAAAFFETLADQLAAAVRSGRSAPVPVDAAACWFRRVESRLTAKDLNVEGFSTALKKLAWVAQAEDRRLDGEHAAEPGQPGRQPMKVVQLEDRLVIRPVASPDLAVHQSPVIEDHPEKSASPDDRQVFRHPPHRPLADLLREEGRDGPPGLPLADLEWREPEAELRPVSGLDGFWKQGRAPAWAKEWGWDRFGPWVTFELSIPGWPIHIHRLRWIRAGRFTMGAQETERGFDSVEGPRHRVTIARGFWMGETQITQDFWSVLIGHNPSHFDGPDHPVESVTYNEVRAFLKRINSLTADLSLDLPTEAQWEYAARAGTEGPHYGGSNHALEDLAWFLGNSGGGTRPVGRKRPNAWGLYDMLGNVWEWCADGTRDYGTQPRIDPVGARNDSLRVLRGGSWHSHAGRARTAFRLANRRDHQDSHIGFRVTRRGEGAEPLDPALAVRPRFFEATDGLGPNARLPPGAPFVLRTDCESLTFQPLTRPLWASAMGRDPYGLWADFEIEAVTQRMRWINPGRFLMGSPEHEPGREDHEGPQHLATLTQGFWLFDTPVTQALWQVVMKTRPSRFASPTRPVEQVSWYQAQNFMEQVMALRPDLALSFPTEAQWEYAARAGTIDATYAGPLDILGTNNAPLLDAIAWYGGNSGVDFDLKGGEEAWWAEKHHDFKEAGTRPVAQKQPNPWGLYDMLGNVREWCADDGRAYGPDPETDPIGGLEQDGHRMVRGGSWVYRARGIRAANRHRSTPDHQDNDLGFRCALCRP